MKKILTLIIFLVAGHMGCAQSEDIAAIKEVLFQQVEDWNRGDVDAFMQGYWNSDSLRFVGASGITYGWQSTLDNYKVRYPGKEAMGNLTFEIKVLERAGPKAFFMVGTYLVERPSGNLDGYFSLLWKKIDGKWLIVVDHSS